MNRRTVIAAVAGSVASGVTGCVEAIPGIEGRSTPTETPSSVDAPSLAEQGRPADICAAGIVDLGIHAIDEPEFGPGWSSVEIPERYGADGRLTDDAVVIGVEHGETARAYPVTVMWHHEIVNDLVPPADAPLLVTFCSLCRSGMVAERLVDGEPTTFGVTGQLWQPPELRVRASEERGRVFAVERNETDPGTVRNTGNLVMFDEATGSYWSQLLGRAICGPQRGESLTIVPSTTLRWDEWRHEHPDTDVLLPPPHSTIQDVPG